VVRLLPVVLVNHSSQVVFSFSTCLLYLPHYTRPSFFRCILFPDVLISGNHINIYEWRHKDSLRRTYTLIPDLFEERELSNQEKKWLEHITDVT
ncbi:tRNA (guanosine(37)-N1)-methyltransferase TrmD, partial [Bacillus tropicus]|nr:tRNA (guanosine(37)-N1)-methyltransferase TrmD [Bacillus tropicus]